MAYSSIGNQALGNYLQIAYIAGSRDQLSKAIRDFEFVKTMKENRPDGKQLNFHLRSGRGPAGVQYRNPNFSVDFPKSQPVKANEFSAFYKEIDSTVEIEYNLWNLLRKSAAKYADRLVDEVDGKVLTFQRRLAADLYGDGSGVICQATSVDETGLAANDQIVVTLTATNAARGFIGFVEEQDILLAYSLAGALRDPSTTGSGGTNTFYGWRVKSKNRKLNTITLEPVTSSYAVITTETASNIVATDVFYRVGQPSIPNLSGSISDWGTASEVMAGLESLGANDGRVIHGITMSGAFAGSREDFGGAAIDTDAIENALNDAKIRVGEDSYAYKQMRMAPEVHSAFVKGRETDRRFITLEDNTRGLKVFGYQHRNDFLEAVGTEFCPKTRIWMVPEAKQNQGKAVELWMSDMEPVKINDSTEWSLKPSSSGGHERSAVSYMECVGVMISRHPAAIASISNFTLS